MNHLLKLRPGSLVEICREEGKDHDKTFFARGISHDTNNFILTLLFFLALVMLEYFHLQCISVVFIVIIRRI